MALQDDYWDLEAILNNDDKKALNRIWGAFCELEEEVEELRKIKSAINTLCSIFFKKQEI